MKIFVDTSVFFKWVYGYLRYGKLDFVRNLLKNGYKLIVSGYVINEVMDNRLKINTDITEKETFIILSKVVKSYQIETIMTDLIEENSKIFSYVNDKSDAQILCDAIKSKSNILLTNNIKDFKVDKIEKDFGIKIENKII